MYCVMYDNSPRQYPYARLNVVQDFTVFIATPVASVYVFKHAYTRKDVINGHFVPHKQMGTKYSDIKCGKCLNVCHNVMYYNVL